MSTLELRCRRSRGRSITPREVLHHISGLLACVVRVNGVDKTLLVDGDQPASILRPRSLANVALPQQMTTLPHGAIMIRRQTCFERSFAETFPSFNHQNIHRTFYQTNNISACLTTHPKRRLKAISSTRSLKVIQNPVHRTILCTARTKSQ
jgi:hypothetical protein